MAIYAKLNIHSLSPRPAFFAACSLHRPQPTHSSPLTLPLSGSMAPLKQVVLPFPELLLPPPPLQQSLCPPLFIRKLFRHSPPLFLHLLQRWLPFEIDSLCLSFHVAGIPGHAIRQLRVHFKSFNEVFYLCTNVACGGGVWQLVQAAQEVCLGVSHGNNAQIKVSRICKHMDIHTHGHTTGTLE